MSVSDETLRTIKEYSQRLYLQWADSFGNELSPEEQASAQLDFFKYAALVHLQGLKGVRSALGGCFICGTQEPGPYQRILLSTEEVLKEMGNRVFFGQLCQSCATKNPLQGKEFGTPPQEWVNAALKWSREHPPE